MSSPGRNPVVSGFPLEGAAAPGDWESVIFDRGLVESHPSLRAINRDPPQMAVVYGRISTGIWQNGLFRDSSPRGPQHNRPFQFFSFVSYLFICYWGFYWNWNLRYGDLIQPHNRDQIGCGDLYLLSDDSSTDHSIYQERVRLLTRKPTSPYFRS